MARLREFCCESSGREHTAPNPEWAFLSDRARNTAGPDWKKMRAKKAAKVLKILNQITEASQKAIIGHRYRG